MAPIPKRIKPSGAYYRKIAKEKKEKLDKTIKNSNRVDKMFHQLNNSVKSKYNIIIFILFTFDTNSIIIDIFYKKYFDFNR